MTTITLDHELFDYSNIKEPLVAVPRSCLKDMFKNSGVKKVLKGRAEDKLVKNRDEAIKEWKEGATTDWRDALI